MKLLIISDTHLENKLLENIADKYQNMDFYIHCGDSSLNENNPLLNKYLVVHGNHDNPTMFNELIFFKLEQYNCMITHGNKFKVHYGNDLLLKYMNENNIDIVFHGHTHVPTNSHIKNKYIINPGSVMMNRGSYGFGTFAIVEISKNQVIAKYYNSSTFEECSDLVLNDGLIMLEKFKERNEEE